MKGDEDDIDLEAARALLTARRASLQEVLSSGAEAAQPVELDQQRVGRLSRMDAMQQQAMSRETDRRRRLELKRIEGAMGRVNSGEYGWCLRCGEGIGPRRLTVDPAALHCVECAD